MIDIEVMQDASEILKYDSLYMPYAIQPRLLSQFTNMKALCHWHPDIECIYIVSGEMYYDVNGKQFLLQEGDCIIVNSQQLHFGYSHDEQECKFFVILFHPDLLKSNLHIYQKNIYPIIHSDSITHWLFQKNHPVNPQITKIVRNILALREEDPDSSGCLLLGLLHCLWHIIYHNSDHNLHIPIHEENTDISLQKDMVSFIYEHYAEDIGLDDIAAIGNISRSKCCKIFQKYLQQSPVAFLNTYRMEISSNLLRNTSYSVTDIAISCGYNHLSYFSKMFFRKFGCTPNQYRKTALQKITASIK